MGQAGKGSKGKDGKGMRPPAHQVRPQSLALSPSASAPSAQGIMVSGCANETVSNIIKGSFSVAGSNHGKHIYKKDTSDPNVTVLIYYWDDRDGSSFSGWWIGPKVGGDQVWSHADNRSSPTPPPAGWHVPWDGPVDPSLTLTYTPATASAAPPPALPAPAPQPGKAAGKAAGKAVGKGQVVGVRPVMKPHDLQMERKKPETIGPGGPQNNRIEELRRKSAEAEEAQRKRQEEMKRNREEDLQRRKEMTAATNVGKVLAKVRAARADSYDALRAQLEESIATNLEAMGSIASKVGQEAEEVLQAAQTRIDDLNEQRAQEDRERAEQEKQRKHEAENSVKFVEEAKSDAQTQLKKVQEAEELCKKLEDEADPTKLLERTEAAEKEVASVLGEANEVKAAIHEKQRRMLTDGNSKIRRELSEVMGKLGAALRSLNAVLHGLKSRREKVARKAAAVEKMNEKKSVFAQFDLDKDGKLSKKEVEAYMKATINFDLPPAILDPIVQKLDPITYAKFRSLHQRLYIAKSELLAREARAAEAAKQMEFEEKQEGLMSDANGDIDPLSQKISAADELVQSW